MTTRKTKQSKIQAIPANPTGNDPIPYDKNGENGFINREEISQQVFEMMAQGEKAIVLQGPEGTGKSMLMAQITGALKKKKYDVISFGGLISAEIFLKQLAEHAQQAGVPEVENVFTARSEYKEKLDKLLVDFIYKQKLLLIFEDFDENQESDGTFRNERLKELLTFLKDALVEKEVDVVLLFATRYEIPKFPMVPVGVFSWQEFLQLVNRSEWLKSLDDSSLQTLYFEMGGFPRVVAMLELIARDMFPERHFHWSELRDRVPMLTERVLHKERDDVDFSYLLLEVLWEKADQELRRALEVLAVYRGVVPKDAPVAHGLVIKPAIMKELTVGYGIRFTNIKNIKNISDKGQDVGYIVPRFVAAKVRGWMTEEVLKHEYSCAATYFAALKDDESQLEARWYYLQAGMLESVGQLTFAMDLHYCNMGYPQFAFDLLKELERYVGDMGEENQFYFHNRMGLMGAIFGRWDEALQHYESSLKLIARLNHGEQEALILGQMGRIYEAKGNDDEALIHFERALAAFAQMGDGSSEAVAIHLELAGAIHKRKGNYKDAFDKYEKALVINEEINKEKNNGKSIAQNLEQLGRIHDEQGHLTEALGYYERSLVEKEALDNQPGMAVLLHQMGNVNFVQGKLDVALEFYQKALVLNEKLEDLRSSGYSRGQIGLIQQRWGNIDVALAHFEKSLLEFEKAKEDKGMAAAHHQVGRIYQNKGDQEQALNHYEKSVELREKTGDLMGAAISYGQLGILFSEKEEWETALRYAVQAFAIFSRFGSPNAELSRQHMLRIQSQIPTETFDKILNEFHINRGNE